MSAKFLIAALFFPAAAVAQGFAGLSSDAEGFALPAPDPEFSFPADHGAHADFRIEWWYVTANLQDADGNAYGAQWTLFRSALAPDERPGWSSPQIWFAHAAVTTPTQHFVAERFARGGIGQAGVAPSPFSAWINDWAMKAREPDGDALDHLTLNAQDSDFGYDLTLDADGPLVLQGDKGFSVKSERGQASYYYSQPFYRVAGTLDLPDGTVKVTGQAWLDREWSSQPLAESQSGWDWFSLHLDGGAKLMVYRLRDSDGGDFIPGTFVAPDGTSRPIANGGLRLEPLEASEVAGREFPTAWRIVWADGAVDLEVRALNRQSWMSTAFAYWEGPIAVSGSHSGVGYLEMTGYD